MKPNDPNVSCKNCRFWSRFKGNETTGRCRREAPSLGISGGGALTVYGLGTDTKAKWPTTEFDDWCGEFQENKES